MQIKKEKQILLKLSSRILKWIIDLYNKLNFNFMNSIKEYKFNDAADALYQFIWKDYCDWYIEFIKPILSSRDNEAYLIETRHVSINVMKNVILMLHPIMPYLTEEISEKLFKSTKLVISSSWPDLMFENKDLLNNIDLSIKLISGN